MARQRGGGRRVRALGVHPAGDLDHGVLVQAGQGAPVADVQDQRDPLVPGDRPHQGERHLLVAPREVLLLALPRARRVPVLRHVGGLALGPGAVPQPQRGRARAAGLRVEAGLLLPEEDAAGLLGLLVGADRLAVEVVVVQVLVGDRAQRLQPVRAEETALLERLEQFPVGEQPGQQVLAVDAHGADPAEVVEPGVVDEGPLGGDAEDAGDAAAEADRGVADADHPVAEPAGHRLGDQTGGVGEVDDPGARGEALHPAGEVHRDRHGAQAVGDAAGADGLLAEDPLGQGHLFVGGPALEAADADRREDEVGAGQRLVQVGGRDHLGRVRHALRLFGQHPGDGREPSLVHVVQHHAGDAPGPPVGQQRPVHERHAEAAPTNDRQPHPANLTRRAEGTAGDVRQGRGVGPGRDGGQRAVWAGAGAGTPSGVTGGSALTCADRSGGRRPGMARGPPRYSALTVRRESR